MRRSACRPKRPLLLNNPWYSKFPTRPPWGRGPPILRSITLTLTARANLRFPSCQSEDSLESRGTYLTAVALQGGKNHRVLNQQCLILFKLQAICLCLDSTRTDYPKDRDDEEGREVRRLALFSIRIGTCIQPRECSYTKVYGNLCSLIIQIQVPLASRGRLQRYPAGLGVTLLL